MADPSPIPLEQRRPLSPHLQIYKWTPTMAASIAHRATGVALYAGTVLLLFYLLAAAGDAHSFNFISAIFGSFLGQLVLFGYTFVLLLHVMGGLRHAIWDAGEGFDPVWRDRLSVGSAASAAVLTILLWIVSFIIR
ncbi:succinate dehydrogenase, cytochrome b556 subunit [Rhodoblastus acidophilus]|jgi:succinate dehydrogenase cytochrome b subunit|uniref:Succinate dehydrogenase cytochrome b556 subunit n=1 Tax=Candidatus Rhodoblastus alkanivorans TaxID=2954117 RepID=A0ABS9Z3S6_9HYPH|nr:succinate dehydrogenase, cytochrome b556 subunit [Candidatus Rhodoblastus alkanivorans]MCI4677381.1 succinate dehydrogenase, cytochrome b556 subunit [Candidatus Rhodoblastus alkanivorans]MCI4682116.1 succinate dehydrogenase, cytochrome b556 subunit [Candidatus Rhodoblastus alkanivorans]MDI4639418.1 succinate dehydrogenase, cytochrome b556 subunit [Rhodoblastus acidophilus]